MKKNAKIGWYKVLVTVKHYSFWRCLYWNGQWNYGDKEWPEKEILKIGAMVTMPNHNTLETIT